MAFLTCVDCMDSGKYRGTEAKRERLGYPERRKEFGPRAARVASPPGDPGSVHARAGLGVARQLQRALTHNQHKLGKPQVL